MTTVLAFGTFDAFHHGHDFLLSRARELGDRLVVGVARDANVQALKGRRPIQSEQERLARVRLHPAVADAVLCDENLGDFDILQRTNPDVIALGFDQTELRFGLERWMERKGRRIPLETIETYA